MRLSKIIGTSIIAILNLVVLAHLVSLLPIIATVLGVGMGHGALLAKQHHYYFSAPMRSILQGDAGCVAGDETLGYVPKLGDCPFENFEFSTVLKFDEAGAVMSKAADAPPQSDGSSIIVVGDSHAMGWGVSYDQTFAYLLSEQGYAVRNYAMSSYGTEQELLSALHSSAFAEADTIIVQYCSNDIGKNKERAADYIPGEAEYYGGIEPLDFTTGLRVQNALRLYKSDYSFWDVMAMPVVWMADLFVGPHQAIEDPAEHKALFLEILARYPAFADKNIIVFYSNAHGALFSDWDGEAGNVIFRDLDLARDDYHRIDDHLTPGGHAKIAQRLAAILRDQ